MDRRHFLQGFGAGAIGLSLPVIALAAWTKSMSAAERRRVSGTQRGAKFCKIIGIGGAGCNCVLAMQSGAGPETAESTAEFICIDVGGETLPYIEATSRAAGYAPIKTISLGPLGAGGNVNYARAAALRKRVALRGMLADADVVILVAGMGGTGSGVTPIMARLAREAGVRTVAAVCITPFEFEGQQRHRVSDTALRYLNREADQVVTLSNEEWAKGYSEDTPMIDVFTGLDRHIAGRIRSLMDTLLPEICSPSNFNFFSTQ